MIREQVEQPQAKISKSTPSPPGWPNGRTQLVSSFCRPTIGAACSGANNVIVAAWCLTRTMSSSYQIEQQWSMPRWQCVAAATKKRQERGREMAIVALAGLI